MRTSRIALGSLAGLVALGLCLPVSAGEEKPYGAKGTEARTAEPGVTHGFVPRLTEANKLIGTKIEGISGEKYGKVKELILNRNRDRIIYALADFKPVTEAGDQLYAVPWSALLLSEDRKTLVLDMEKQKLASAPGFAEDRYPNFDDRSWCSEIDRFYGQEERMGREAKHDEMRGKRMARGLEATVHEAAPAPEGEAVEPPTEPAAKPTPADKLWGRKVSGLVGLSVDNPQKEELGTIEHVMVDLYRGRLAYAIVGFGGLLGIGQSQAAVPWSSVELREQDQIARVATTSETLEAVAFKSGESPSDLSNRTFARRIHERFNQEPYWEVFGYVGPDTGHAVRFDPEHMRTIEGTIDRMGSFRATGSTVECQELHLRGLDGSVAIVHGGPADFVQQHGLSLAKGDRITVIGSHSMVGDRSVILATEIRKGEQSVQLRDAALGSELWSAESPGHERLPRQPDEQPAVD